MDRSGRLLLTGATGFLGSALASRLEAEGYDLVRLTRRPAPLPPGWFSWDPEKRRLDLAALDGVTHVVHLAGENLFALWTGAKKRRLLRSREESTALLAGEIARRPEPPVFVSASAVGFFGSRGAEILTEESPPGVGFLADLVSRWEAATAPAERAGARVVHLRMGIVLSPRGGALAKMVPAFRLGLGATIGDGQNTMSWIALEDLLEIVVHVLRAPSMRGAVHAVAPFPVTQAELSRTLARVLGRPAWWRVPAGLARLLLGEMVEEMVLASARVEPRKLLAEGYSFRQPELEGALRSMLVSSQSRGGVS